MAKRRRPFRLVRVSCKGQPGHRPVTAPTPPDTGRTRHSTLASLALARLATRSQSIRVLSYEELMSHKTWHLSTGAKKRHPTGHSHHACSIICCVGHSAFSTSARRSLGVRNYSLRTFRAFIIYNPDFSFPFLSTLSPLHSTPLSIMSPKTPWITKEQFLSQDAVRLGQLVLRIDNPAQDFHIPRVPGFSESDYISTEIEALHDTLERTKGSAYNLFLTKLFSTTFTQRVETTAIITAPVCKTYQLKNSGDYFSGVCRSRAAREWLERAFKRRESVFLVVGKKTMTDAVVMQRTNSSQTVHTGVETPSAPISGPSPRRAIGLTVPIGVSLEMGVGHSGQGHFDCTTTFMVPGERVYAVQFRKVELSWFSGYDVDKSSLEQGNRWKVYLGGRRGTRSAASEGGQERTLCAQLQESPEIFDWEGDRESFVCGDSVEEMLLVK
jgi:hypothetical protein